jgi:hypothetical protein
MNPMEYGVHKKDTASVYNWLGPYCIDSFVKEKFTSFSFPQGNCKSSRIVHAFVNCARRLCLKHL